MYNGKFVSAVICAAGASSRMKTGTSKQLLRFGGMTVIERTVRAFQCDKATDEIIVVCPESMTGTFKELLSKCGEKPLRVVAGGAQRQDSVKNGVDACDKRAGLVAVHDGARPFITAELIENVVADGEKYGCATLAVPVKDTIKRAVNATVTDTPAREELWSVQTPQVFCKRLYLKAFEQAAAKGISCTDDCRLIELSGGNVHITMGSYNNIKITTPEDIAAARGILSQRGEEMRVGHGYDVHKLGENRKLIIGGVDIPYERGLVGHSDADVLTHAVMDALLGAAGMGDIGGLFPDTDPAYEGADSIELLKIVCKKLSEKGFAVGNIDATVVAQKPKLKPYINEMKENIAAACDIPADLVNVKATTEERLGFTGREEGISAHAVCVIGRNNEY